MSALSIYAKRPQIVHKAILTIATSSDQFPDLGKLLTLCERFRREAEGTMPQDAEKLKFNRIDDLAKAWGLDVG